MSLRLALSLLPLCLACLREPPAPAAPSPAAPSPAAPSPALPSVRFVVHESGGARSGERLPLLVALHGLGDSPENFIGLYTAMGLRVRVAAAAGLDRWGDGYAWFASRAEVPPARWAAGITRAADALVPAIRALARERPTCGVPIVTGFSQGGMLAYAIAARPDGGVAAALPLGGLLPASLWPRLRPTGGFPTPVFAFHGSADARVPFDLDRDTHGAFRAAGHAGEFRDYPGVGHSIPPAMQTDVRQRLAALLEGVTCPR
jgi:phospholipase/carboxylesterase